MVARARARARARANFAAREEAKGVHVGPGSRAGGSGGGVGVAGVGEGRGRTKLLECDGARLAVRLDNRLRVHALLNVRLALAQELARQQHDGGRAVTDLRVL